MKYLYLILLLALISCKQFSLSNQTETSTDYEKHKGISKVKSPIPEGGIKADFLGNKDSVYAFIKKVDTTNETTLISFENSMLSEIIIPESLGAKLNILKLNNYHNNALLVTAISIDTNFNEYYLFVWKESAWKQPVNHFFIHKSNITDSLVPIRENPNDSTQILRYYSVFEMDQKSEKKYNWSLLEESVLIED